MKIRPSKGVVQIEYQPLVPSWFLCYAYDKKPGGLDNNFFHTPEVMLLEENLMVDHNGLASEKYAATRMGWQKSSLWETASVNGVVKEIDEEKIKSSVKKLVPLDKGRINQNMGKLCEKFHSKNETIASYLQKETNLIKLFWSRSQAKTARPLRRKIDEVIYNETMHGIEVVPPLPPDLVEDMKYNMTVEELPLKELYMKGRDGQKEYFDKLEDDPRYMDNCARIDAFYAKHQIAEEFKRLIDLRETTAEARYGISEARKRYFEEGLSAEEVQRIVEHVMRM